MADGGFFVCPAFRRQAQDGDGQKRQVNTESGKASFLGPEGGKSLTASEALALFARPGDPAMALAKKFSPEFGLKNPERDLAEMKHLEQEENGRLTVDFQSLM